MKIRNKSIFLIVLLLFLSACNYKIETESEDIDLKLLCKLQVDESSEEDIFNTLSDFAKCLEHHTNENNTDNYCTSMSKAEEISKIFYEEVSKKQQELGIDEIDLDSETVIVKFGNYVFVFWPYVCGLA